MPRASRTSLWRETHPPGMGAFDSPGPRFWSGGSASGSRTPHAVTTNSSLFGADIYHDLFSPYPAVFETVRTRLGARAARWTAWAQLAEPPIWRRTSSSRARSRASSSARDSLKDSSLLTGAAPTAAGTGGGGGRWRGGLGVALSLGLFFVFASAGLCGTPCRRCRCCGRSWAAGCREEHDHQEDDDDVAEVGPERLAITLSRSLTLTGRMGDRRWSSTTRHHREIALREVRGRSPLRARR